MSVIIMSMMTLFLFSACSPTHRTEVDQLNYKSYSYHYKNLDSTRVLAERALILSKNYSAGVAEALNNLAFVSTARMNYKRSYELLNQVEETTDNQIELLIADIQYMRLCQRRSKNKEFYDYRERAERRLNRINEESTTLTEYQRRRIIYAKSEFDLINSVYFYYVGLKSQSIEAIQNIDINGEIQQDTAQVLSYLYNVGAGGIITSGDSYQINQREFDYLIRCYLLAFQTGYTFFEAQALQAMSEHLRNSITRQKLIRDNFPVMKFINIDNMPDTLLAGNLAQRSLELFTRYGDVYQIAGSYRTLAECYWSIHDYNSALICLKNALKNETINQAPDLVASIREQLCLVYSAVDDKVNSDRNRNIYLDLQEQTRQDRQLEARAEQLNASSIQLNLMIFAVLGMIIFVIFLLILLGHLRRRADNKYSLESLLEPLKQWKITTEKNEKIKKEKYEELMDQIKLTDLHILNNKKRNLEQRAKVSLVNSITPLIDRMINEVNRLQISNVPTKEKALRYEYISELTDVINDYNDVLTQWIQMRQGELSLHIESFPLQDLFDIVNKGRMSYQLKGISLVVEPTQVVIKADKTLTLFMINTLMDNARKFTPKGGFVTLKAVAADKYVEIEICDTGVGMSQDQLEKVFDYKPIRDDFQNVKERSHGFGLVNCKGIIEKYKKISQIFSVCMIKADSEPGLGSTFRFRLPRAIRGIMVTVLLSLGYTLSTSAENKPDSLLLYAQNYADSVYFSNVNGRYKLALFYADNCRNIINRYYQQLMPNGKELMVREGNSAQLPAEIRWFRKGINMNYNIVLDLRNESAVAALALHRWNLYDYNNKVYTQLFREKSADNNLPIYVHTMQRSESNKTVAVILLVLLLLLIFPAYYFLYYRHRIHYRFYIERVNRINKILLGEASLEEKQQQISKVWGERLLFDHQRFEPLDQIVGQIQKSLQQSVDSRQQQSMTIELAEDELHKAEYEDAKLHISNNILDNCLSTLKHETMYYPSRIRQLIDGTDHNLEGIAELVSYYKDLYTVLSAQAMRQIDYNIRLDEDMIQYLFYLLRKQNGGVPPKYEKLDIDDRYFKLSFLMNQLKLTSHQIECLFTPNTKDVQFLLCRQLVREIGESTNARGCGIQVYQNEIQVIIIEIILPQSIWKILKLS